MEDFSTTAFKQSFVQFSCEKGYSKFTLVDQWSQLVRRCEYMKLTFNDIKHKLHKNSMVKLDSSPVGRCNYNAQVERRICQIKDSLKKNIQNERLSVLQCKTLSSVIWYTVNDLFLGLGNIIGHYENMHLITPNRFCLGSYDGCIPAAIMEVTGNPNKGLKENKIILSSWVETWYITYQNWRIAQNGFVEIVTSYITLKKIEYLAIPTSKVWSMNLYPANMALFVKLPFATEKYRLIHNNNSLRDCVNTSN